MTARHEGMDRPHHHVVDRAALEAALANVLAHLAACAVCALARATAATRGRQLGALDPIERVPEAVRDRYYRDTNLLYCPDGQRLIALLGDAAFGEVVLEG